MAEEGCKLFVYGIDQNMANGDIQVTNYEVEDGMSKNVWNEKVKWRRLT